MVDFQGINSVNKQKPIVYSNVSHLFNEEPVSLFSSDPIEESNAPLANADALNEKLDSVMEEQGIFSKGWNGLKEALNLGTSAEKCEDYIQKYKNGEMSFEEASAKIDEFASKQESSLNLFSNIASSVASIAAVTAGIAAGVCAAPFTGGASLGLVAAGIGIAAGAGATAKTAFKAADRATNDVKGDTLNAKQLAKDALSGAVTGAIAGATMGNGTAGATLKESVAISSGKAIRTGVVTGAVSGSSNYAIECAFEDDKDFDLKDFTKTTAESAFVGGVVGGIMGSANGALRSTGVVKHGGMVTTKAGAVQNASTQDVVANSLCSAEYKIVNDRIRAIAS